MEPKKTIEIDREAYMRLVVAAQRTLFQRPSANVRWPCPECGRANAAAPLKLVLRTLENNDQQRGGCVPCNLESA